MSAFRLTAILLCFQSLWLAFPAAAAIDKSGVRPQVLSLPSGPGSIEGLGESFEPQLNTGTVAYAVKLVTLPGRAGFKPELTLHYNGGNGNSPFGLGWTLSLPSIQRQTDKGFPAYTDKDSFIESGGEELVRVGDYIYRAKNESAFMRYERSGQGWIGTSKSGVVHKFGLSEAGQIKNDQKVFRWLLQEMVDPNGNSIFFDYASLDEGAQRYLAAIRYNENGSHRMEITFQYESRSDKLADYRPTFRLETAFRCKSVTMKADDGLVRRYDLGYVSDAPLSLLESVTLVGADGATSLPPARFTYTTFDPAGAEVVTMAGKNESSLPPGIILSSEPDAALNDMNGDGLPDLLIAKARDHHVYFNLGKGLDGKHRWGALTEMGSSASPDEALGNEGASLADIDGDGKTDFIARRSVDTYFIWKNLGTGKWGSAQTFAGSSNLPFDFENPAVRLLDVNNDKHIDVMYCEDADGESYRYYLSNGKEYTVHYGEGLGGGMTFDQRPGMKLADMNGDRLQDIVLIQDGKFLYWPASGTGVWDKTRYGDWGSREVGTGTKMTNPPDSEADALPALEDDYASLELVDLNGDGLADVLYVPYGASYVVYWLNIKGIRFEGPYRVENTPVKVGMTSIQVADMNGNGTTDLLWNFPEDSDVNRSKAWQYLDLSPTGKPYLLKTATNGIGRKVIFVYGSSVDEAMRDRSDRPWPTGVPMPVSVLAAYDLEDGRGNTYSTRLRYHDGYYDGIEKEFRGFASVEKIEVGDDSQGAPTLVSRHTFDTGSQVEALKGKPLGVQFETELGQVFYREAHTWVPWVLEQGTQGDSRTVTFAYASAKSREIPEGGEESSAVKFEWTYEYDSYGNLTVEAAYGRVEGTNRRAWDDERIATTRYTAESASGKSKWILDKVVEQTVSDGNGVAVSRQRNFYDGLSLSEVSTGNLTKTLSFVDPATSQKTVRSVRNDYDSYGNIIATYDALWNEEPGHYRQFEYDQVFHTFPIKETIHTGELTLAMTATYDPGPGVMKTSTDFNGFATTYAHDPLGRLVTITRPPDPEPTVRYVYDLARVIGEGRVINSVETKKRDPALGGTLDSKDFFDGLGRKVMTRARGEETGQVVVTDTVQFNARKQPWKKYLPYFVSGSLDFVEPALNTGFTQHFYDALGREIRVNQPAGSEGVLYSTVAYMPSERLVQDEEQTRLGSPHYGCGMRYVEDGFLDKEGKGRLREVYERVKLSDVGESLDTPVEWKTIYSYNTLGKFTGYTDSQGNQKEIKYDGLGRMTFMNDPDRGQMSYVYDAAGNLRSTLDAKNQTIRYEYDGVNRLKAEYYGETGTTPDVEYHYDVAFGPVHRGEFWRESAKSISSAILNDNAYRSDYDRNGDGKVDVADVVKALKESWESDGGTVTAENTKGYLSWVKDQSGEEHNSYDSRGRVKWVVKRIIGETAGELRNFFSGMDYDSLDRITQHTYPDGSTVSYNYNSRGLLESIPNVINQYHYNPAGQNALLELACGAVTTYTYDHRLRLSKLQTVRSRDGLSLQDLSYTFDGVSNILQITDGRSSATLDAIGAELGIDSQTAQNFQGTQYFTYDSLYRLTKAANESVFGTIKYRYDRIGNMILQQAQLIDPSPEMDLGVMTSGGTAGPHALTKTEKGPGGPMTFTYDANGNMHNFNGPIFNWDFKDRIITLTKGTQSAEYLYDYSGSRKKRMTSDSSLLSSVEAVYYNDRFSEVRGGRHLKYVYAGNNHTARSDVILGVSSSIFPTYFYLHDHLGSSVLSLDDRGGIVQQATNYPYGHPRKETCDTENSAVTDYGFVDKERDTESGLHYFGARYYAGFLGRFVSADPLATLATSTLTSAPKRLGIYSYGQNNPIVHVDPSGMAEERVVAQDPTLESLKKGEIPLQETCKSQACIGDKTEDVAAVQYDSHGSIIGIGGKVVLQTMVIDLELKIFFANEKGKPKIGWKPDLTVNNSAFGYSAGVGWELGAFKGTIDDIKKAKQHEVEINVLLLEGGGTIYTNENGEVVGGSVSGGPGVGASVSSSEDMQKFPRVDPSRSEPGIYEK